MDQIQKGAAFLLISLKNRRMINYHSAVYSYDLNLIFRYSNYLL